MRMAAVIHIYYLSKPLEFLDTIFFVATKKFRNVSKLQVIHHAVMPFFTFCLVRWLPNGNFTFYLIFFVFYFQNVFLESVFYSKRIDIRGANSKFKTQLSRLVENGLVENHLNFSGNQFHFFTFNLLETCPSFLSLSFSLFHMHSDSVFWPVNSLQDGDCSELVGMKTSESNLCALATNLIIFDPPFKIVHNQSDDNIKKKVHMLSTKVEVLSSL